MPVERMLPSDEAEALVALAREIAQHELKPAASQAEAEGRFPREKFKLLGQSGLLGLPYPERWGGGEVPYEVYLQVLEEIAAAWMTVGVGLSVHTMSSFPLARFGTDAQRDQWLPAPLAWGLLGGSALAQPPSARGGAPRSWRGPASVPPRCPSRRPVRTRPRCRPARSGTVMTIWSAGPRPGSRTPARPTSTRRCGGPATTGAAA